MSAFIDDVTVTFRAGSGGRGAVSFYRARSMPWGGPDGGHGGSGGDIYLVASRDKNTLSYFVRHRLISAKNGQPGAGQKRHGASGIVERIFVPCGTRIYDHVTGVLLADLIQNDDSICIVRGGRGGIGNVYFKSSTNRAPRQYTEGEKGECRTVRLSLSVLAEVGLLGLPNAGKSSLLRVLSHAKPKVGAYPFTTLQPHLGIVPLSEWEDCIMADIPGVIEGASKGIGLGMRFLKHLSRCSMILHVISLYEEEEGYHPVSAFQRIIKECHAFDQSLISKKHIVVFSKSDAWHEAYTHQGHSDLQNYIDKIVQICQIKRYVCVSAEKKEGLEDLRKVLQDAVFLGRDGADHPCD